MRRGDGRRYGRNVKQPDETGVTLSCSADCLVLVLPKDQVAFPVACLGAVLKRELTLTDGLQRLREPRPLALHPLLRTTNFPGRAKR